jgi:hypothetical protein
VTGTHGSEGAGWWQHHLATRPLTVTLNVLRHNVPPRDRIRRRKLRAALNDDYRLRLLFGQPSRAVT